MSIADIDPSLDRKVVTIVLDDAAGGFHIDWRGVPWLQFVGLITEIYAGIFNGDLFDQTYGRLAMDVPEEDDDDAGD